MPASTKRDPGDANHLASSVRQVRRKARLTQEALAQRAGISISTVRNLEQGVVVDPGVFQVAAIARALETSIDELLSETSTPATSTVEP
ncbi:helix-turn-helix transcriptional regulator [uncultured Microbacterium sp.]|uniref:helix-turn-helix domain-containing protein n=1 Tax=uncultured Microbacterium sp. TaxID=191216 RepID=UPI00260F46FA|nr:helix-turn-helix transcriptional regulator [uncultured Microbacterium sp.]